MSTELLILQRRPRYITRNFHSLQSARLDAVTRSECIEQNYKLRGIPFLVLVRISTSNSF